MSITIPKQENHFPSPITWRGQRKRSPLHGMGLREMLLPHCWTSHQPTDPVGQRPKGIWGLVSDVQQGDRKDPKSMIQAPTKGRSGIMDCGFYGVTEIVNSLWEQSTALRESSLSQSPGFFQIMIPKLRRSLPLAEGLLRSGIMIWKNEPKYLGF